MWGLSCYTGHEVRHHLGGKGEIKKYIKSLSLAQLQSWCAVGYGHTRQGRFMYTSSIAPFKTKVSQSALHNAGKQTISYKLIYSHLKAGSLKSTPQVGPSIGKLRKQQKDRRWYTVWLGNVSILYGYHYMGIDIVLDCGYSNVIMWHK